ncbi:MAG: class I SAM-dependent methyltransferase [Actinomycetota bacterium]|nr:class I SAM-dependent methyltransferase [Actinomycetota bacterium]
MVCFFHNPFNFVKAKKYDNRNDVVKDDLENDIVKNGSIFEVDCWKLSELLLERVIPNIGAHPYPLNEQMLMAAAVAFVQPCLIVEWGTHHGKSARLFWEVKEALGLRDCRVCTVDSMDANHPEFPGAARGRYLAKTKVEQFVGDGFETAGRLLEGISSPILLYIDGDHSRQSTRRDLSLWARLPSGSGLLAHDVLFQTPSAYNIGPWQSLQELLETQRATVSHVQWQLLGLPGMAFVSKK